MNDEGKAIGETAKAAQELSKATGKAIDAGVKFGQFISRFTFGPLEQASGIFEDKLKYLRWERQVRLMRRAEELMREFGLEAPTRAVPLKFAIPLLQGASLEDDDEIQDMWARLLINAANATSAVSTKRVFIEILENIGPLEAKILQTLYSLPFEKMLHKSVITIGMPDSVTILDPDEESPMDAALQPDQPTPEVELALANLARLGCLSPSKTWDGGESFRIVNPSLLGKSFVDACTLRNAL